MKADETDRDHCAELLFYFIYRAKHDMLGFIPYIM